MFFDTNINLVSRKNIIFRNNSSLLLNANSGYQLFLQTNKNCQNKYANSTLSICSGCNILTSEGAIYLNIMVVIYQ